MVSDKAKSVLSAFPSNRHVVLLKAMVDTFNSYTGCAIADLLALVAILQAQDMSLEDWSALYSLRCSCLTRLEVPDRSVVKTTVDECRVVQPPALQEAIDRIVAEVRYSPFCVNSSGLHVT